MIQDKQYLEEWASQVIADWQTEIEKRKIRESGTLAASFEKFVTTAAGGNIQKIKFTYLYYGTFVKLGVGKGQTLADIKDNSVLNKLSGAKGRRAKNWKDQVYNKATQALYAESFRRSRLEIRSEIKHIAGKIELNF